MSFIRQDAWTKDEDLLLAEVVLRHIREGSTQLKAFEEVSKKLNRTAAACGFRWNSTIRKQYKEGIELAKKQRKELKKISRNGTNDHQGDPLLLDGSPKELMNDKKFDDLIIFLRQTKTKIKETHQFLEEMDHYKEKIRALEKKITELQKENDVIKNEYLSLLSFMEKARKLAEKENEGNKKMNIQLEGKDSFERAK